MFRTNVYGIIQLFIISGPFCQHRHEAGPEQHGHVDAKLQLPSTLNLRVHEILGQEVDEGHVDEDPCRDRVQPALHDQGGRVVLVVYPRYADANADAYRRRQAKEEDHGHDGTRLELCLRHP